MAVILCMLFIGVSLHAEIEEYGPVRNFKGTKQVTSGIVIPTTCETGVYDPINGEYHQIKSYGGGEYEFTHTTPVFVDSYIYVNTSPAMPFDPDTDTITFTEIFAYDLEPGMEPNLVPPQKGFSTMPGPPEIIPTTGEFNFISPISGTNYSVPIEEIETAMLPMRLPGYALPPIMPETGTIVYVVQAEVPAYDFVMPPFFDFEFEYQGYLEASDPCWRGSFDPEYPYQHYWELNITQWAEVEYVSDVHIEEPWNIRPGSVQIIPPDNWHSDGVTIGRAGFEANTGGEITAGGGSLGCQWRMVAKLPQVVPGQVYLTKDTIPISNIKSTMVPASTPEYCGDWSYHVSDINLDCQTDLGDVAELAAKWLECTDPDPIMGCVAETIVGVGFGFNGDDASNPATVGFLHGTGAVGYLEPNDIIVEYRGVSIASGAMLQHVIEAMPDVAVGNPVPMKIVRSGYSVPIDIDPLGIEIEVVADRVSSSGKNCVQGWITPSMQKTCSCVTGSYICACGWEAKRDKSGKIIMIKTHCADTGGNVCHGDWVPVK